MRTSGFFLGFCGVVILASAASAQNVSPDQPMAGFGANYLRHDCQSGSVNLAKLSDQQRLSLAACLTSSLADAQTDLQDVFQMEFLGQSETTDFQGLFFGEQQHLTATITGSRSEDCPEEPVMIPTTTGPDGGTLIDHGDLLVAFNSGTEDYHGVEILGYSSRLVDERRMHFVFANVEEFDEPQLFVRDRSTSEDPCDPTAIPTTNGPPGTQWTVIDGSLSAVVMQELVWALPADQSYSEFRAQVPSMVDPAATIFLEGLHPNFNDPMSSEIIEMLNR